MMIKISYANNWMVEETVEINSLEDLISLRDEKGCGLIIDRGINGEVMITVYNGYME